MPDMVVEQHQKRVYLDLCALNRPLDDQNQIRIRLEAVAVSLILTHVRSGVVKMIASTMHFTEIAANPDAAKREHLLQLLGVLGKQPAFDPAMARRRAETLRRSGFGPADAAHFAIAEQLSCDFVTVDDRFLRQLRRTKTSIWIGTPMAYCEKEDLR